MGLFSKKIGTVFLKETGDESIFIKKMQELQEKAEGELAKKIEKQINLAKYGEFGEKTIAFELKHSGIDMYVLHDIYLEIGELSAQIDYIVITRQHIYVIECKNLIGNIEIDNTGAFVRSYELFGKRIKEGIYSPITQNERHLQVLKEIRKNSKGNFITKAIFEKYFYENYHSIVVLANPKTYLNARFAPKHIKEQVIRADQLITYIKQKDALSPEKSMTESEMLELAKFYLAQNKPERADYARKYNEIVQELEGLEQPVPVQASMDEEKTENVHAMPSEEADAEPVIQEEETTDNRMHVDREEIVRQLKAFRMSRSRAEKKKPYYIFNDAQMNDLLDKYPHDKAELLKVSGFGDVKIEKYGEEILKILWKDSDKLKQ